MSLHDTIENNNPQTRNKLQIFLLVFINSISFFSCFMVTFSCAKIQKKKSRVKRFLTRLFARLLIIRDLRGEKSLFYPSFLSFGIGLGTGPRSCGKRFKRSWISCEEEAASVSLRLICDLVDWKAASLVHPA